MREYAEMIACRARVFWCQNAHLSEKNGTILDVESSSVRLILISIVPFCFSFLMRCFNSSCCAKEVLLATIKDSVETLSEIPAMNTRNSIFLTS